MRVRQRLETGFDFDNYQKNFVRSAQDHAKICSSCCYLNRHLKGFCYNNELQSSKLGLTIRFKFSHGVMMRSGTGVTRGDNEADRRVVMCHVSCVMCHVSCHDVTSVSGARHPSRGVNTHNDNNNDNETLGWEHSVGAGRGLSLDLL